MVPCEVFSLFLYLYHHLMTEKNIEEIKILQTLDISYSFCPKKTPASLQS